MCGHGAGLQTAGAAGPGPGPVSSIFIVDPRQAAPPVTSWTTGQSPDPVPPPGQGAAQPAVYGSPPVSSPAVPGPVSGQPLSATPVAAWSGGNVPGSLTWLGQVCPVCGHDAGTETGDDAGSETEPGTGAGPGR